MGKGFRIFLGAVWFSAVSAGFGALWNYELRSTAPIHALAQWPAESKIARDPRLPLLILFAHPKCPCTRASLRELDLLMAQCQGAVNAKVVFFQPENAAEDWAKTDLWDSATAIPGVSAILDRGGKEARLFRAATSGQVLLYAAAGDLLFSGGITSSRGHSGDNAGRSALVAILHDQKPDLYSTFVYGCSIASEHPACQQGVMHCEK